MNARRLKHGFRLLWLGLWLVWSPAVWAQEESAWPAALLWGVIVLLLVFQTLLIIGLQRSRLNNKRARNALRQNKVELEARIAERTESLNQTNQQLQDEVAHHQATEILLRETQDYLHSIINAMPSVLIGVTPDGTVTHWNSAAELATGLSPEQALGRPLAEVYPALPISMETITRTIESGVPFVNENIQEGQGSNARYTDLSIYPLIAVQAIGAVIRLDDITMRVRIENMMIQNEKMMSLGELAAGMAHEINNPLSTVLHGVQNIQRRTSLKLEQNHKVARELGLDLAQLHQYLTKRRVFHFLEDIREAGERSMHIVSNMLEFSRGNNRAHEQFDLGRIIQHTLELSDNTLNLQSSQGHRRPEIITELAPDLPPVVGSAAEIQQVILNLLRNAVQALQSDERDETPDTAPVIHLRAYLERGAAVLQIEDNGPGMSEEVRRHIFEPFFTTKEVGQGTGLGLSVSYFIITEHHSGTIEVDSMPGEGTCFTIRLPLADRTEHHRPSHSLSSGSSL
ncbi:ATP-binding protein [Marinimicrobium sp. C6131]|uniref:two-component system sensor histidine kinase NtrB n=1 Tax=Marinimicrobium sp. C6131 TaxID=3022676 RepID=UPI00223CB5FC|nr:ATP-binding protein [Marinimicrobium sp. C6131]UZJ45293.1 ATP-binding protein [Marinimicrobium sp. C6131]